MTGRRLRGVLVMLWGLSCVPSHAADDALREGNRLFRQGDLEAALEVYRDGFDGRDPVLAYNLATTAHHLGRLPEAVLWYRRGQVLLDDGDPWLSHNLDAARQALDAPRLSPPAPWGFLKAHRRQLEWVAIGGAWLSLSLLLVARRRSSRRWLRSADWTGLLALVLFTATLAGEGLEPTPAVMLEPCGSGDPQLVAGSEVWGRKDASGDFRIELPEGETLSCPMSAVGRIRPKA